jgi:hypothetical protein
MISTPFLFLFCFSIPNCVQATMGDVVELTCPDGRTIQNITFASYGDPGGHCGSYVQGTCHSPLIGEYLQKECYRKPYCNVTLKEEQFGLKCDEQVFFKTLRLQFTCSGWCHHIVIYLHFICVTLLSSTSFLLSYYVIIYFFLS